VVRRRAPAGETGHCGWEQVSRPDVREWMAWLLSRYSSAYASNQLLSADLSGHGSMINGNALS
jgi:hypothetical protein